MDPITKIFKDFLTYFVLFSFLTSVSFANDFGRGSSRVSLLDKSEHGRLQY